MYGGNKEMKKIMALLLSVGMLLSFAACSQTRSLADIQKSGKLVMATNAEFEPFEYHDGNEIVGIDIDISEKIAEKLGVELEVLNLEFDALIPALQGGKADMIAAGMTADEDRKKNVDFSESYYNAAQVIIVTKDSPITGPADLAGKTVGVQQGTTGDKYCTNEDGESEYTVGEVKRYSKGMEAVSDLMAGRLDAVVIDSFPADKFVEKNSDTLQVLEEALTEYEECAIAVPKANKEHLDKINEVIREMKESGELEQIVNQY